VLRERQAHRGGKQIPCLIVCRQSSGSFNTGMLGGICQTDCQGVSFFLLLPTCLLGAQLAEALEQCHTREQMPCESGLQWSTACRYFEKRWAAYPIDTLQVRSMCHPLLDHTRRFSSTQVIGTLALVFSLDMHMSRSTSCKDRATPAPPARIEQCQPYALSLCMAVCVLSLGHAG